MRVKLDYGRDGLEVELPDERVEAVLGLHPVVPAPDPDAAVRSALASPVGTPPLAELAQGRRSACILISDITRPVPNRLILPPILETLETAGIPREGIEILVATGTHRASTPAELDEMVGPRIAADYRIRSHDAHDLTWHRQIGVTERGVPAWVDRGFLDADLKISIALIEPHFMAGFSGGRKSVCPGICAMETVKIWHGPRFIGHELADAGSVHGNPVHEDSLAIARMSGLDMICDVTIDSQRRIVGVFAGEVEAAWLRGVESVRRVVEANGFRRSDVVLTTTAGYPLDLTFYQAVKGMVGAIPAVKPGGTILVVAKCDEGIGGEIFTRTLLETEDLEAFVASTYEPGVFVPDQWEVHELLKAVRHANVMIYSEGIPEEDLARCFVEPVASVESGVAAALERHGPNSRLVVIPKGPYVVPVPNDEEAQDA